MFCPTWHRNGEEEIQPCSELKDYSQWWLNYQCMVEIARMLIKADPSGSWLMHLQTVLDCLPVFGAAGHFNYLQSDHYYWQAMSNLGEKHVYLKFLDGYHFVRRSNQSWTKIDGVPKEHWGSNSWQRDNRIHVETLETSNQSTTVQYRISEI